MAKTVRLLLAEDSAVDAELLLLQMRRGGLEPDCHRVDNAEDFRKALETGSWDIVICDHVMPSFDSFAALRITRELESDLPFIVVSGTVGEEVAVQVMKAGANDYLMKDKLTRMVPAIERELREAHSRRAHKRAQAALRESEERLGDAIESISEGFILYDADERFILCNSKYRDFYAPIADMLQPGARLEDLARAAFEAGAIQGSGQNLDEWMKWRLTQFRTAEGTHEQHLKDGRWVLCSETRTPAGGTVGIRTDITERKRADEALRKSRDQLRMVTDNLPVMITYVDAKQRLRFVNRTCAEWYGRPVEDIIGRSASDIHGPQVEKFRPHFEAVLAGAAQSFETTVTYGDGVTRDVRVAFVPHIGADSGVHGFFSFVEDVTEYRRVEEQLRQAQKMEAVGQLTGGIAHDFNNLLGVILGNAELLSDRVGEEDNQIRALLRAASRGAELTQRLLAFSRRQPLQPKPIDANALASGMVEMLRRSLGAAIDIKITSDRNLWTATADPGLLENALLNLAINARDAMSGVGLLVIEIGNVTLDEAYVAGHDDVAPGDYVVLAVTDNGSGMPPEVLSRVFEPFYTTKEVGKGSGLGLSMVYGFAKQSGGHITIDSEQGQGTTVKLYLPRSDEAAVRAAPRVDEAPRGRGETVLVVEDDADIRQLATVVLSSLGYQVLEARDGEAALEALGQAKAIDLLLTAVVLPGSFSGPDLALEAGNRDNDLKIVFMSGYTEDAMHLSGWLDKRAELLPKPFRKLDLARKVRAALDGPAD